ncbi:MAG: hypothetical protein ACYC7A_15800 [Thermoanaerobaculia bacterium]
MPLPERNPASRGVAAAVFVVTLVLSLVPVRSYDYFWHLATGRWILDHQALPATDPLAVASDPVQWINGSWLFQAGAAAIHAGSGHAGVVATRAVLLAVLFAALFLAAARRIPLSLAAPLVLIAWYGAEHRLGARPETLATILLAVAIPLALRERATAGTVIAYAALSVLWINVHPSALLAPLIAAGALAGRVISSRPSRPNDLMARLAMTGASALALLVNPYGIDGVLAPLRLARLASGDTFVNLEWLPSRPTLFPLLYVMIALGALAFARSRISKLHAAELILFAAFAVLAIRYVRNHGFFFVALPLLLAPALPASVNPRIARIGAGVTAAVALLLCVSRGVPLEGGPVEAKLFPVRAIESLRQLPLHGTIYCPDQFGGFVIWSFYPERRALTDGRNELHRTYISEYAKARTDGRAWQRLLAKYEVTAAVEEYRGEQLEAVDAVTGARREMAPSLALFPRTRWALIGFDDAAMVFVDRTRVDKALLREREYRWLVPDGSGAGSVLPGASADRVRAEIGRALRECGQSEVLRRIAASRPDVN